MMMKKVTTSDHDDSFHLHNYLFDFYRYMSILIFTFRFYVSCLPNIGDGQVPFYRFYVSCFPNIGEGQVPFYWGG